MNSAKPVSYATLRRVLEAFGFTAHSVEGRHLVFTRPERSLLIALPERPGGDPVRPIDLMSARNTLVYNGLIRDAEEFEALFRIKRGDRLVWTEPRTKRRTEVVAASGETSDGMVLVTHAGTPTICPVDQLIRVEDAVLAAG